MKDNFEVYSQILCNSTNLKLDAETLISMFSKASLSIEGSMNGAQERSSVFYLNKFLRKCEQDEVIYNDVVVSLETVLEFLTGGNFIPFGGFFKKIDLDFNNAVFKSPGCNPLPTSSTCNLILFLPRNFPNYLSFENIFKLIVMERKEFGHK